MSNLTDLEICKRIAEIEGYQSIDNNSMFAQSHRIKIVVHGEGRTLLYNPLTDDALCFRLMVKYTAFPEGTGNDTFRACVCNWQNKPEYYRATGETLNKAICLAIIEASK